MDSAGVKEDSTDPWPKPAKLPRRGTSLCGVVLAEATCERSDDQLALSLADMAARAQQLLFGRPVLLAMGLPCSGLRAFWKVEHIKREQENGWKPVESWDSIPAMHDHFCARLKEAAKSLGCAVQWDRTFKTNSDPLYCSFVRWQMRLLHEQGRVGRCQRPMVYHVGRGKIVPIYDRGFVGGPATRFKEGIPWVSTHIAIRQELLLLEEDGTHPLPSSALSRLRALLDRHTKIYVVSLCHKHLVELVFRQTGCAINQESDLGAYLVLGRRLHHRHQRADEHDGDRWVVICSKPCALHMAHQGFVFATVTASNSTDTTTTPHQTTTNTKLVKLAELKGQDLAGLSVRCPIIGQQEASVPIVTVSHYTAYHTMEVQGKGKPLPEGARKALVAQVLASPDTFPYSQAQNRIETTNTNEERCIVASMDSYFLDFATVDETGTEWKTQVLGLVESMRRQGCLQWDNLLSKVRRKKRWYVGSYEGQGTRLPWDDRMVVTPPCEQALLHAYFAVAPIVKECGDMSDEDWDRVFEPKGRTATWSAAVVAEEVDRAAILDRARHQFRLCYPMHVLVAPGSGHGIQSALVSLYIHMAVWGPDMCPRNIRVAQRQQCVPRGWDYYGSVWWVDPPPPTPALAARGLTVSRLVQAMGGRWETGRESEEWDKTMRCLSETSAVIQAYHQHRDLMRGNFSRERTLMLWAHLREPESAFARLPLELVVYIMRHLNAPGGLNALPEGITIDPAAIDRSFGGELNAHFLSVARALHASDLRLALTIVFKQMQGSLQRYMDRLRTSPNKDQTWRLCNVRLMRRCCKIMSCALLPVCTEWSSVAWRSWISGKRDSDSSLNGAGGAAEPHRTDRSAAHDHDQQQALDAESARAMGRWWRKHVVDDERMVGTVTLKSQALRELTTSVGDLRAAYLWRLIERCKRERWRKRLRGTRPTTLVITAWPRRRSLPHWAEKIAAILARNNQAASEAGGYNSERAKEARQEVRRFVLHDAALRPHIKHLMDVTSHFQEQMMGERSGQAGVGNAPFDEVALIKRFEPFIRRKAGVPAGWALVLLESLDGDGDDAGNQFGCVPGRPFVAVHCQRENPNEH